MPLHEEQVKTIVDGAVVRPLMKSWKMECCDCGLVHKFVFKVKKGRLEFRAYRDKRATKKAREKK